MSKKRVKVQGQSGAFFVAVDGQRVTGYFEHRRDAKKKREGLLGGSS